MKQMTWIALCSATLQSIACLAGEAESQPRFYEGVGRVSAAVSIADDTFITGSDQDNLLRIYRTTGPTTAIACLDVSMFLGLDGESADICGAARLGDRIYWITSHSRDEEGRMRPNRYRFFATTVMQKEGNFNIEPAGKSCTTLLERLPRLNTVSTLRLDRATRLGEELLQEQRQRLAPTREGLNIAALCADPHVETLFIGFRNPRPTRVLTGRPHALMIPLNNGAEVTEKGATPIFGEATLWDFEGLGITDLVYSPAHGAYFILAQPFDDSEPCLLYRWSGMKANPPELLRRLSFAHPNATTAKVVALDGTGQLLLLIDGGRKADATPRDRFFTGVWIRP